MRPVARIAQSVEQGIENPRVLGSIPSPAPLFKELAQKGGFCFSSSRTLHRTPFDYSPHSGSLPRGQRGKRALFNACGVSPESGHHYLKNPPKRRVFAFLHPDSSSNSVRLFAAQRLTPSGPARQARCSTPAALVRVRAPLFKEPAQKAGFCFSASGLFIELRSITRCPAALLD